MPAHEFNAIREGLCTDLLVRDDLQRHSKTLESTRDIINTMGEMPYPFVSELLFRAKNHSINSLSTIPITQLWRIESLEPDVVMTQLSCLLKSTKLSSCVKLKLGFLIGYSWPLHHHRETENLLICAKNHIDERHVAESLLLWGNLASCYLRDEKVSQALSELTQAFKWATTRAQMDDLAPLLNWATLIFIRLNRSQLSYKLSNIGLILGNAEDDSHSRQCLEYVRAVSQIRLGNSNAGLPQLLALQQKINSGNTQLDKGNQSGVIQQLAQLALDNKDTKETERLLLLSEELNQDNRHTLMEARIQHMRFKLALLREDRQTAAELAAALISYQDNESEDLDIVLKQQITQIRQPWLRHQQQVNCRALDKPSIESEVRHLEVSFLNCVHAISATATQP